MDIFQNAAYIWCAGYEDTPNCYINCHETLTVSKSKKYCLYITAHTDYALYINGDLHSFGQYADYPDQVKIYDTVDISDALSEGPNALVIIGYSQRVGSSTQTDAVSGILYVITEDGTDVCHSSLETDISLHPCYHSGPMEWVSGQLGYSFRYDALGTAEKGTAVITAMTPALAPRPIPKLQVLDPAPMRLIANGCFIDVCPDGNLGQRIQNAGLYDGGHCIPDWDEGLNLVKKENTDGVYAVIDLGREEAGILCLDVESETAVDLIIGWGEHLDDLRVRTYIGTRNFACSIRTKPGRFTFVNPLRRLGCRYLQIHAYGSITLHKCTLIPTNYPVNDSVAFQCADHLHNEIYETCKRTLLLCMHEHYEDSPWREQALYTMDSRNQMLCGYYVFKEKSLPRASLKLIGQSIRDDDFLELCSPSRIGLTIPSFNAIYIVQMWEYLLFSGDLDFAAEMLPVCERICRAFLNMTDETGLIPMMQENGYWNFYEWQDGLANDIWRRLEDDEINYDLALNAFISMAWQSMGKIMTSLGRDGSMYLDAAEALNRVCHKTYYNTENGWYWSKKHKQTEKLSHLAQLPQALAICAGICPDDSMEPVLEHLAQNGDMLPVTLSHAGFYYDALMHKPEKYGRYVFDHVAKQYGKMLKRDATAFWETISGGDDFEYAGSLCHGWSAIPAYLYFRYIIGIYPDRPGHMGVPKPLPPSCTGIYEAETNKELQ